MVLSLVFLLSFFVIFWLLLAPWGPLGTLWEAPLHQDPSQSRFLMDFSSHLGSSLVPFWLRFGPRGLREASRRPSSGRRAECCAKPPQDLQILPLYLSFQSFKGSIKISSISYYFIYFLLTIFIGFRHEIGVDWDQYVAIIKNLGDFTLFKVLTSLLIFSFSFTFSYICAA